MSILKPKQISHTVLLTMIFCIVAGSSSANSSSYYDGDGVTIIPIENKNIVMKSEIVKIRPDLRNKSTNRWLAECEFTFYNKSDSEESVTMGYPDWLEYYFNPGDLNAIQQNLYSRYSATYKGREQLCEKDPIFCESTIYFQGYKNGKLPYFKKAWKVHDLVVIIDRSKLKTVHKPINTNIKAVKKREKSFAKGPEESIGAFIWQVQFGPTETKVVKVMFSFGGLSELSTYQELSYLLKTGALWADNIEQADIYWDLYGRELKVEDIRPKGYKLNNKVIHWHFENFKPSEDIGIFVTYYD